MSGEIATSEAWRIAPERSRVTWSVTHLGVSVINGSFEIDSGGLAGGVGEGTVAAASVRTDDRKRDSFVRSAEFLDAEAFPQLRLAASGVDVAADTIEGELTIRDTTLPLKLDVERAGQADGLLELDLTGTVLRRAYGLRFPQAFGAADRSVSDDVKVALALVFVPAP